MRARLGEMVCSDEFAWLSDPQMAAKVDCIC